MIKDVFVEHLEPRTRLFFHISLDAISKSTELSYSNGLCAGGE